MGKVIDLIYDAFIAIQSDGSLILDYDFMIGIFADLQKEMHEFNTYMTWFFEEKECNTIRSSTSSKSQRVLSVDKGVEMLFYPTEKQNMQTNKKPEQQNDRYFHSHISFVKAIILKPLLW